MKRSELITLNQVKDCLSLLHEDYHDCEVHMFNSKLSFVKWCVTNKYYDKEHIRSVLKGLSAGYYRIDRKFVHIYLFSHHVPDRYFGLHVIRTLYHEVRHHYQYSYQCNKWVKSKGIGYRIEDSRYNTSAIERDANKFAARMCIKHKDEISKILDVYPDWIVYGYE